MWKRSIFKKLLFKLKKGSVFSFTEKLLKQFDSCLVVGKIYIAFSNIFICRMELHAVVPAKPMFYKRYIDDTYSRRKENDVDKLQKLNSYNENINLTLAVNPTKFLDTELVKENGEITTQVFSKSTKLTFHWRSTIPVRYKRNFITKGRTGSDFNKELKSIRQKYQNAGFPLKSINETISNFERAEEEIIIPE